MSVKCRMLDIVLLSRACREPLYSRTLAVEFRRSKRAITKRLRRLVSSGLLTRVGRIQDPFQWYEVSVKVLSYVLRAVATSWAALKTGARYVEVEEPP